MSQSAFATEVSEALRTRYSAHMRPGKQRQRRLEARSQLLNALCQGLTIKPSPTSYQVRLFGAMRMNEYVERIEEYLFTHLFDQPWDYTSKVRALCYNLRCNAHNLVRHEPTLLATANAFQLAEGTTLETVRIDRKEKLKAETLAQETVPLDHVGPEKCRCGSWRTMTVGQAQLSSADEPMTNFYRCYHCGRGWKHK
jgi:DNA-directed RNA polymerase subunit M/transcription elongation factor TFIIS